MNWVREWNFSSKAQCWLPGTVLYALTESVLMECLDRFIF